jgi:PAS domain S-box-containing protein
VSNRPGEEFKSVSQEDLLKTAIEGAGILLFLVDESGIIQLSTGRQDFLFLSKPGLNPIWNSVYFTFADYPAVIQDIERTLKGESRRSEIELSNRLLEARFIPLTNAAGLAEGVVLTFTDITKHRQTETALKQQERFVQLLQEIAVASNEAEDAATVLQYGLNRICSFTGWPVGHVVPAKAFEPLFSSKSIWQISEGFEDFRKLREDLVWMPKIGLPGKVLETGEPKWFTAEISAEQTYPYDDKTHLKTAYAFPILSGKETVGVLEFFSNETEQPNPVLIDVMVHIGTQLGRVVERKRSEMILRESEETFRSTFADAGIGVVLQSLDGVVIESNLAFQTMFGFSTDQLRGTNFKQFTHLDDLHEYQSQYDELVCGKRSRIHMEMRYVRQDQSIIWVSITASLLRNTNGSARHVILLAEDITSSRQLQSELDEVRSHLMKYREQERVNIARDLHDGPLQEWYGVIYVLQEMIETTHDQDIIPRLANLRLVVEQQIHDLRAMANELRPPTLVPFGLAKAIDSHVDQFQDKHPEFTLHVELEEDGKLLPEEMRLNLFRIYQELLNNIVRHAQATQVYIRFYIKENELELQVEDDGEGFEVPNRWIETARQGHLGLLGARERAESIGGKFFIQSSPNKGTFVRVLIPLPRKSTGGAGDSTGYAERRMLRS